jgi:hypothetical protein
LEELKKVAIVLLAGEASQRKFSPYSVTKSSTASDRVALQITVTESEIPRLLKAASELVAAHWSEIEFLAESLLRSGTVNNEN